MESITADELDEMKEDDENLKIVDVLGEEQFEKEHVPGAINIPYERIANEALDRFDKDDRIVVYCKNKACTASPEAAEKLDDLGFKHVYDFENGIEGWKSSGREAE